MITSSLSNHSEFNKLYKSKYDNNIPVSNFNWNMYLLIFYLSYNHIVVKFSRTISTAFYFQEMINSYISFHRLERDFLPTNFTLLLRCSSSSPSDVKIARVTNNSLSTGQVPYRHSIQYNSCKTMYM